jgi:hypothetical protein
MSERTARGAHGRGDDVASAAITFGLGMWPPMLGAMATWNRESQEGLAQLSNEWLAFANRRMKEDLSLPQRLLACQSPEEVWGLYAGFWRNLLNDYCNEYAVMMKLGGGLADRMATMSNPQRVSPRRGAHSQAA